MSSAANYTPTPDASLPASLIGNVTTEQVVLSASPTIVPVSGGTSSVFLPLVVQIPPGSILEKQRWSGVASGYLTAAAALSATLKLYSGTSATPGNNSLLATSGAVAIAAAGSSPFIIKIADAIYDSVSGKLAGVASFIVNGTFVAAAALSTTVTGINNNNSPVLSLCLSATFSVANAANLLYVAEFEIAF